MGKKTKLREAQRQRAAEEVAAVLAARGKRSDYPALVATYGDFKPHYHARLEPFYGRAVRAPEKWRCRIKSRHEDDRFVDLVRHTFARYPVAAHLERAWVDDLEIDFGDRVTPGAGDLACGAVDLREWYIVAGGGGSLYHSVAHPYLTRQETHHFLTAPAELTSPREAFWYALTRAEAAEMPSAINIARSRLSEHAVGSAFWRDCARFFARQGAAVTEINDLLDFLHERKLAEPEFSVKGRTIASLRRAMAQAV